MTTLNLQAAVSGDDAMWREVSTAFWDTYGYSDFGHLSTRPINTFIRFPGVTIPQGATINVAYLSCIAYFSYSDVTCNVAIAAIDEDNAAAPTDYASAEGATRTTASVAWSAIPAWTEDETYQSPSIITVIQEIVDRVGWASGNAIVIYIEDNGSSDDAYREVYTYDDAAPANRPTLHIEYSTEPVPTANKTYSETISMRDVFSTIGGDPTEVRDHPHTAKWYMAVEVPRIVWKGVVQWDRGKNTGGDLEADLTILVHHGANEAGFDLNNFLPDLTAWIGTTDEGKEHGKCRVRSYDGYNMVVAADMTCVWREGDYITITDLHEFWPMLHKTEETGGDIVVWKDNDLDAATYKAEEPVPIMGPPACEFRDAITGLATVEFNGGGSYLVQPNSDEDYWTVGFCKYASNCS